MLVCVLKGWLLVVFRGRAGRILMSVPGEYTARRSRGRQMLRAHKTSSAQRNSRSPPRIDHGKDDSKRHLPLRLPPVLLPIRHHARHARHRKSRLIPSDYTTRSSANCLP